MTRLSDSLRGLADRAPVEEVNVSVTGAARRIRRGRRLRAAANATAGVGVASVIALAALNPGASGDTSLADGKLAEPGRDAAESADGAMVAADGPWGVCGWWMGPTATGNIAFETPDDAVEPGSNLALATEVTIPSAGTYTTHGGWIAVTWQDLVVAVSQVDTETVKLLTVGDGDVVTDNPSIDLVNCWDGTPLPGGDYEVMVTQEFTMETAVPETGEPAPTPSAVPSESTTVGPAAESTGAGAAGSDGTIRVIVTDPAGDGTVDSSEAVTEDIADPAPPLDLSTVVIFDSDPQPLRISGDAPEDPFGSYLYPTANYPDDYLYPDLARELYTANVTDEPWSMEEGTQRVVKTADSLFPSTASLYYGCDGTEGPETRFPEESAELDLLDVSVDLPGRVDVNYGWLVEDNPRLDVSVTNVSDYSLPGFWGPPSATLYLVKDGKVVAEGYPTTIDPNAYMTTTSTDGMLAPGTELADTYVWRDVSGCWSTQGQTSVEPGTYTVLNLQYLSLDDGTGSGVVYPQLYGEDAAADSAGSVSDQPKEAAASSYIDDGGISYGVVGDWIELQVWTSLGTVTID